MYTLYLYHFSIFIQDMNIEWGITEAIVTL
jgi:hypothetical protein